LSAAVGFDHVFWSEGLRTISCEYLIAWLDERLSDHAAIEAVFDAESQSAI
jgi:hypothetical protein